MYIINSIVYVNAKVARKDCEKRLCLCREETGANGACVAKLLT